MFSTLLMGGGGHTREKDHQNVKSLIIFAHDCVGTTTRLTTNCFARFLTILIQRHKKLGKRKFYFPKSWESKKVLNKIEMKVYISLSFKCQKHPVLSADLSCQWYV